MSALTLASKSAIRRQLLANAGVDLETLRLGCRRGRTQDPRAWRPARRPCGSPQRWRKKALAVPSRRPGLVIGADQTLETDGNLYDKVRRRPRPAPPADVSWRRHLSAHAAMRRQRFEMVLGASQTARMTMRGVYG